MPLWRDPLDELIDELDKQLLASAPAETDETDDPTLLFGFQMHVAAIMDRDPGALERAMQDPHVRAYLAHLERSRNSDSGD